MDSEELLARATTDTRPVHVCWIDDATGRPREDPAAPLHLALAHREYLKAIYPHHDCYFRDATTGQYFDPDQGTQPPELPQARICWVGAEGVDRDGLVPYAVAALGREYLRAAFPLLNTWLEDAAGKRIAGEWGRGAATKTALRAVRGHSEGPWECRKEGQFVAVYAPARGDVPVCTVHSYRHAGEAEERANGELIARVPELAREVEWLRERVACLERAQGVLPLEDREEKHG